MQSDRKARRSKRKHKKADSTILNAETKDQANSIYGIMESSVAKKKKHLFGNFQQWQWSEVVYSVRPGIKTRGCSIKGRNAFDQGPRSIRLYFYTDSSSYASDLGWLAALHKPQTSSANVQMIVLSGSTDACIRVQLKYNYGANIWRALN